MSDLEPLERVDVVTLHDDGSVVLGDKGKELATGKTLFPGALWLQKTALSLIGTVGTNVMRWLTPRIVRLQRQYESAPGGHRRFVSALKLKTAVSFYHLLFKVQKRIQNRHLCLLRPDELVLQLQRQFGHLGGRYPILLAPFDKLPDLFAQINAAADEADRQIGAFKKSIVIHTTRPPSKNDGA